MSARGDEYLFVKPCENCGPGRWRHGDRPQAVKGIRWAQAGCRLHKQPGVQGRHQVL